MYTERVVRKCTDLFHGPLNLGRRSHRIRSLTRMCSLTSHLRRRHIYPPALSYLLLRVRVLPFPARLGRPGGARRGWRGAPLAAALALPVRPLVTGLHLPLVARLHLVALQFSV